MTVLITGASRGIGRALYDAYGARGGEVLGTRRGPTEAPGWLSLDVRDPAQHNAMAAPLGDRPEGGTIVAIDFEARADPPNMVAQQSGMVAGFDILPDRVRVVSWFAALLERR